MGEVVLPLLNWNGVLMNCLSLLLNTDVAVGLFEISLKFIQLKPMI
jgi:hypothetical protein